MSVLLSVTFACGVVIAISHVINRRFVAPVYDVIANLTAFACAVAACTLAGCCAPVQTGSRVSARVITAISAAAVR